MKRLFVVLMLLSFPVTASGLTVYFADGSTIDAADIGMAYGPSGSANAPNPFSADYEKQVNLVAIKMHNSLIKYCNKKDIDWEKTNTEIRLKNLEEKQKALEAQQLEEQRARREKDQENRWRQEKQEERQRDIENRQNEIMQEQIQEKYRE